MKAIQVGGKRIGEEEPCFVIAEIGVNHEGSLKTARELVEAASAAGVDAVKFQVVDADALYPPEQWGTPFHKLFKSAELSEEAYGEIQDLASSLGLVFFASFSHASCVETLARLNVPIYKVASTQLTNLIAIERAAATGRPMILSTGMAGFGEVEDALQAVRDCGNQETILLHCVSNYPANPEQVNLRRMDALRAAFGLPVGFSDHTPGITASVAAVARGACVIERHFTLDPRRSGFDHHVSSDPREFKTLVAAVRDVERMLRPRSGDDSDPEAVSRREFRVSLAAARDITQGEILGRDALTVTRPGLGIPPKFWRMLLGQPARRMLRQGEQFRWEDL